MRTGSGNPLIFFQIRLRSEHLNSTLNSQNSTLCGTVKTVPYGANYIRMSASMSASRSSLS